MSERLKDAALNFTFGPFAHESTDIMVKIIVHEVAKTRSEVRDYFESRDARLNMSRGINSYSSLAFINIKSAKRL